MNEFNIFNKVLQKDRNEPINFDRKSENILNQVNKIRHTIEKIHSIDTTNLEKYQMIKAKQKEEKYLSLLDHNGRKNFQVKKKLYELISPYDEGEKRLDEIISVANIKSLADIFKIQNKKNIKLFEIIKLKRRKAAEQQLDNQKIENNLQERNSIKPKTAERPRTTKKYFDPMNEESIQKKNKNNGETIDLDITTKSNVSTIQYLLTHSKSGQTKKNFYNPKKFSHQVSHDQFNTTHNNLSTIAVKTSTTANNLFRKNTSNFSLKKINQTQYNRFKLNKLNDARKDVKQLIYNHKLEQSYMSGIYCNSKSNSKEKLNLRLIATPSTKISTKNKLYSKFFI